MNAQTLLQSQGWGGPGTALQQGGVTRAILTSKKADNGGLGAKPKESDQWWDNVFSSQLQNIQVCAGANGKSAALQQINGGVSAAHPVAARAAHKRMFDGKSALERVFVMGEVLKAGETFVPLAKKAEQAGTCDRSKSRDEGRQEVLESAVAVALKPLSDRHMRQQLKRVRKQAKAVRKLERVEKRKRKAARQEARELKALRKVARSKNKNATANATAA